MLCIGRGEGTINGLRTNSDSNTSPIPVFTQNRISGIAEVTFGKKEGQPTLHVLHGTYSEGDIARISPASNTTLFVLGQTYAQWIPSGSGSRDFKISDTEGLLIIAF